MEMKYLNFSHFLWQKAERVRDMESVFIKSSPLNFFNSLCI